MITAAQIKKFLDEKFSDAHCELNYSNDYELIISIVLSAQSTDKSVNLVTPKLFQFYPTIYDLANADFNDVKEKIKMIGLSNNKAKNIINLAKKVVEIYEGKIPNKFDDLVGLDGVGRKSAEVFLCEVYKANYIPVDTHVFRVSKRLEIACDNDDVITCEHKLEDFFKDYLLYEIHMKLIFMGRYFCLAKNPKCIECPFNGKCKK